MALRNIIGAVLILGFALWYGWLASFLPSRLTGDGSPGANFFPYLITAMMLILGAMLLVQGLRDAKSIRGIADLLPKDKKYNMVKPTVGIVLIGVYFSMLKLFGFFWCTPPMFVALMWINGERRPKVLIPLAVIVPVFLYLLFEYIFLLPLPTGSLVEWP